MLTEEDFRRLSAFALERWGLVFDERKRVMVGNRITALGHQIAARNAAELLERLMQSEKGQLALFDVLSTNHTNFFREPAHFDILEDELFRPAASGQISKLRIWSAGCSAGCEPYTLSILLSEHLGQKKFDVRILATDLSREQLTTCRRGVYSEQQVNLVTPERMQRHFVPLPGGSKHEYCQVKPHLRPPITFAMLNLLEPWKMKGPFDAILCRNVMIYFNVETRERLAQQYLRLLRPGGLFFVGTSESLTGYDVDVEALGGGAYRKPAQAGRMAA